jgi:hypothetical protein
MGFRLSTTSHCLSLGPWGTRLIPLDEQLHGYRQGHQLLSSTIRLTKDDQDLIDRLSDIAGPLGPDERFAPYITCYPLTGGSHYVVARTWQDLDAPRAGCVRTRSVLVPMSVWIALEDVAEIVSLATEFGATEPAKKRHFNASGPTSLPKIDPRQGIELVEALFLEERVPIVVFDAEQPELLTLRIVTALWPGFRRHFAVSTFCRSPRTIARRSFDLVFAPKDARSRFGDWSGRRVDGRKREGARHPWSMSIVERVLLSQYPSLKTLDAIGEMSADGGGSEAALRVSLLWEELQQKAYTTPNAVLGLLDIANTRSARNANVVRDLEPALANAARMAVTTMAVPEAWRFLRTLVNKLEDTPLPVMVAKSIRSAAMELASKEPFVALSFLASLPTEPSPALPLVGGVGDGLAQSFTPKIADQLSTFAGSDLLNLALASPKLMKKAVANHSDLPDILANALSRADRSIRLKSRAILIPLLIGDLHAKLARVLFSEVDEAELKAYITYLYQTNGLQSETMRSVVIERAKTLDVKESVRDAVSRMEPSNNVDAMLRELIEPKQKDLAWVLASKILHEKRRTEFLYSLLSSATRSQLKDLFSSASDVKLIIDAFDLKTADHVKLLASIAREIEIPPSDALRLFAKLLPHLSSNDEIDLTLRSIDISLQLGPTEVSSKKLAQLLNKMGNQLNGNRVFQLGLQPAISAEAVARNIEALNQCKSDARKRLFEAIEEMVIQLTERYLFDLTHEAADAAAALLWESRLFNHRGLIKAAADFLPFLLEQPKQSASPLIAAIFPVVYGELAKENPPDLIWAVFSFVDWDKCKIARRRLIESFMRSNWRVADIALAAARASDTRRILGLIARERGGPRILQSLSLELESLPAECRRSVAYALAELSDKN